MTRTVIILLLMIFAMTSFAKIPSENPLGLPGTQVTYHITKTGTLPESVVKSLEVTLGKTELLDGVSYQWLQLMGTKENNQVFFVWLLCSEYPATNEQTAQNAVARYIFRDNDSQVVEFRHNQKNSAILPTTGAWEYLLPRSENGQQTLPFLFGNVRYLGHRYRREINRISIPPDIPQNPLIITLSPDVIIGVPHNTRQKDETRRYDESDYEYIRMAERDYLEMIEAGLNCFRVDSEQANWIEKKNVYYWGIGGKDIIYPGCLYQSNYLGPVLFFDEPMVVTRDRIVKPKLQKDPALRKTFTPHKYLQEFKLHFHEVKYEQGATNLLKGLSAREDVDLGDMDFLQQNMYSWETMVSSAIYQLAEGHSSPPFAMVFEPPGRFGTRRILPELNMCFECQIPTDNPKNLIAIIYGFLRGAARVTGKKWGVSIYGAVDRADTFWLLTHAYDLGSSLFFYWDSYQLACVPYNEVLAMTRHLKAHAKNFPDRNLKQLTEAAEVAILLPPGYNLGHVHMGRGVFSAIPELNLERTNTHGISYRQVMNNFYIEIERCLRLGIEFDLFWNLEDLRLPDYREVINIREDGKVKVITNGKIQLLESARVPPRPEGFPPELVVEVKNKGLQVTAIATVQETTTPIFYTLGTDKNGVYNNQYVLWELFGPEEQDYSNLWTESWNVNVSEQGTAHIVEINFDLPRPGIYRLRAATADMAGRSAVSWKEISVKE